MKRFVRYMTRGLPRFGPVLLATFVTGFLIGEIADGPGPLKASDWMQFTGSVVGAVVTIAGAYFVFHLQTKVTDSRKHRTIVRLVEYMRIWGLKLQTNAAAKRNMSEMASATLERIITARAVAEKLETEGPTVASVARRLRNSQVTTHLERISRAEGGVHVDDARARNRELVALADECLYVLRKHGL